MSESWPLPDDLVCPECGEDTHLTAEIEVEDPDGPTEATLRCGVGPVDGEITGCGHTWEWSREEDD